MREIAQELRGWADRPHAIATVIGVRGSAPRPLGATLAVDGDGRALGNVSGGCVEGAVYELARQALADGQPSRAVFGYSDDEAFAVGLTCGGEIEVLVRPADALDRRVAGAAEPLAVARIVAGPEDLLGRGLALLTDGVSGTVGDAALDAAITQRARTALELGAGGRARLGPVEVFIDVWASRPELLIYGAIDYAAALAQVGAFVGYRVTVCDARAVFATAERFPAAHEVVVDWPHRHLARTATDARTAIVVLTHDAKFDVPLLIEALGRECGYVGALGSRRTDAARRERLRAAGVTEERLAALRSPIGLNLGARTPEETALSIAAEIVALRTGADGRALRASSGPIHHADVA
jgi:xanthine dehydrogenase accessory factor